MQTEEFDLFGDPIPKNWGKRGRPEHIPTQENALKVKVMLADDWSEERIAAVLRCSVPTLRKHYFSLLEERAAMRDRMKVALKTKVFAQAIGGDSGSQRLMSQMIAQADLVPVRKAEPKPRRLGKKEQAALAAQNPAPQTDMGQLLAKRKNGQAIN